MTVRQLRAMLLRQHADAAAVILLSEDKSAPGVLFALGPGDRVEIILVFRPDALAEPPSPNAIAKAQQWANAIGGAYRHEEEPLP